MRKACFALHPENLPEVLIDPSGMLTLGASCKELGVFRCERRTEDYLVSVPTARRAGFPADLSTNGSDLADLFLHLLPPCPGLFLMSYPLGAGGVRIGAAVRAGNTVEVGVHQPKEGSVLNFCCLYPAI